VKPAILPEGEMPWTRDPFAEDAVCARCQARSARARKERDGLCLVCADELYETK